MSANSVPSLTFSSSRPSDTLKINLLSIYELCSGAHSGCCMVASAAGGLLLRLQGCGAVDGLVRSQVWAEASHLCQS